MGVGIETVTFTIEGTKKKFTIKCEQSGYADAVLGRFINGEITESEAAKLKKAAQGKGKDQNVIETCEIGNNDCITAAEMGLYEEYDIIPGETFYLNARPKAEKTGYTIRTDFKLPEGRLYKDNKTLFDNKKGFWASSGWANRVKFNFPEVLKISTYDAFKH